jgi:biotin carboxylase
MKTFLCISTYFKGSAFLTALKKEGAKVFLVTSSKLKEKSWPFADIDEMFYLDPDDRGAFNNQHLLLGTAALMKNHKIDAIVALDDFDVERAAMLREHFRVPGMGSTTARYYRDKLAMRVRAASEGIKVPAFTAIFNDSEVSEFAAKNKAPWVIKPRSEASGIGIKKIHSTEQLWEVLNHLDNDRHKYLLEQFKPGKVYHIDAVTWNKKTSFITTSEYLATPLEISQGGGVFRTITNKYKSAEDKALIKLTEDVHKAFKLEHGASHTEAIKCNEDGEYYFLETSARVGGAHIAEMVEASSGINLWAEWAKIESCKVTGKDYKCGKSSNSYAGLIMSLTKDKNPDLSFFQSEELYWTVPLDYHVGLIMRSKDRNRIAELLDLYTIKIAKDLTEVIPPSEKILNSGWS